MPTETPAIRSFAERPVAPRSPFLSRNNIRVLSLFIVFMALNTVLRYIPNPDAKPRVSFFEIGSSLGTGFGSLLLFWIPCKGSDVGRRIKFREELFLIAMAALGLVFYVAFFVYVAQHSESLIFIIAVLIPLVPVFYFVIGFIIGLLSRMVVASDRENAL